MAQDHTNHDYPDDADGEALRSIAEHGSDMSQPMVIDFHIDAPDQTAAEACQAALEKLGLEAVCYENDDDERWTVEHSIDMVPNHADIVAAQDKLSRIAEPLGCLPGGWGTFGNAPDEDDEQDG